MHGSFAKDFQCNHFVISLVLLILFSANPSYSGTLFSAETDRSYIGSSQCCECHQQLHPKIVESWQNSRHHLSMIDLSRNEKNSTRNCVSNSAGNDAISIIGYNTEYSVAVTRLHAIVPSNAWLDREPAEPHDVFCETGKGLDASILCFGCHTTGYFVTRKEYQEPGIGCEACHGPGSAHLKAQGSLDTIVNPATLSPERNKMVCGQCHSVGKDKTGNYPFPVFHDGNQLMPFVPGTDLASSFIDAKPILVRKGWEYSLFVQSADEYASQLCTDCHEPHGIHENAALLIDASNEICLKCHGIGSKRLDYENHWGLGNVLEWPCWDCHRKTHSH
jgi:predicted CXXCH cytochrome family protein